MKVIVEQYNKRVIVRRVTLYYKRDLLEVSVDTDVKYPFHLMGHKFGGGKPAEFEIYLRKSKRSHATSASIILIPTTKREIKLFSDCNHACVTSRFGPLLIFYPSINRATKIKDYNYEKQC